MKERKKKKTLYWHAAALVGAALGSLTKIPLKVKSQQNDNSPQTTIFHGLLQTNKMATFHSWRHAHSLCLRRNGVNCGVVSWTLEKKAIAFRNLTPYIPLGLSFQMEGAGGRDGRLSRMIAPKEEWRVPGNAWLMVFSSSWSFFLYIYIEVFHKIHSWL